MRQKLWRVKSTDIEKSARLAVRLGIPPLIAQLLVTRGIETVEAANAYLYPTPADLHDPFAMPGMEKAVERIHEAIKRGEQIWIFGDYDADGTTAAALLLKTFRELDVPANFHIPDRFKEGYGLNEEAVRSIREADGALMITVDCGIKSVEEVKLANELGLDVIITDHHQLSPGEMPPAHAMVTPKVPGSEYPFDGLAGVGLAFKLAHGLMGGGELTPFLIDQLDLVALGTVVDVASLTDENRVLTKLGLMEMNNRKRPGIRALCKVANHGIGKPIIGHTLGFVLGPRINAAGRMETGRKVVDLLTTESDAEAMRIAQELNKTNQARKDIEKRIQGEAIATIEKDIDLEQVKGLVVARKDWHPGVIGIVASRILERYYRPVFLLAIDEEQAKGSGRCIAGMNLADSLNACTDLLVQHGGHQAAAGLTIQTENIEKFTERFNEYACDHLSDDDLQPKLNIDLEIHSADLTLDNVESLDLFEPFGQHNPSPTLAMRELVLQDSQDSLLTMGKAKEHLKLFVTDGHQTMEAVGWGMADHFIALKSPNLRLDMAFAPEINEWNNERRVQLRIKDLHIRPVGRHKQRVVFPENGRGDVKLVDRRNTNKPTYLSNLLERGEPSLLYVRDAKAINQLVELLDSELNGKIGQCDEKTSEGKRAELIDALADGELLAIISSCTLTELTAATHFVFCHPVPQPLTFFSRCQPAFNSTETAYIHLTYNSKDVKSLHTLLSLEYPDKTVLTNFYRQLKSLSDGNGHRIQFEEIEEIVSAAEKDSISTQAILTGLTIFEELEFLRQHEGASNREVELLPPPPQKRELQESKTYLHGEELKQTSQLFADFQLRQNIEQIWRRITDECQRLDESNSIV